MRRGRITKDQGSSVVQQALPCCFCQLLIFPSACLTISLQPASWLMECSVESQCIDSCCAIWEQLGTMFLGLLPLLLNKYKQFWLLLSFSSCASHLCLRCNQYCASFFSFCLNAWKWSGNSAFPLSYSLLDMLDSVSRSFCNNWQSDQVQKKIQATELSPQNKLYS